MLAVLRLTSLFPPSPPPRLLEPSADLLTVKELPHEIVFLHQVQPGGADKSYGIEAGRLAGLPSSVIARARQVMGQIEKHSKIAVGLRKGQRRSLEKDSMVDENGQVIEQLDLLF